MYKKIIYTFISGWLFFIIPSVYAWQLPIEVAIFDDSGERVYNKIVVGIESGATDSFDNLWDTQALVSHPDPDNPLLLRAYTELGIDPDTSIRLWKDIRGPSHGNITWDIIIDSVPEGKNVVFSWDVPDGLLKSSERLVLRNNEKWNTDGQAVQTEITGSSSYAFVSDSEEMRSLYLVYSKESTGSSGSGSGSVFGCGTIKLYGDRPPDGGTAAMGIVLLFSPLVFLRLLRRFTPRND